MKLENYSSRILYYVSSSEGLRSLRSGEVSQMGLVPAQMEIDAIIQEMDTDRDGYALLAGAVIVKWP